METPSGQVSIVPLPAGSGGDEAVAGVLERAGEVAAVVVAGPDAAGVGEAVAALRGAGVAAAGWVGDPSDPEVREMAAELYPGYEIVGGPGGPGGPGG